ncbi:hypothetical protein ACQ4PT_067900 [Festuca glaucescens]
MASGSDDLGEAGVGPETLHVHNWVPEGMELRFAFLVNIRRDRYIVDAKKKKKFQGGFDYPLPMDCNWSFRQFGDVICSPYPWGLHDEVEFRYYDGGTEWVKVSNDAELATMFSKHKEKGQFHVRLQNDVVVPALGPSRAESCRRNGSSSQNSSVGGPSVSARRRGGLTSVGTGSRFPREVEPDYVDDEERLYSDVVQNLRWACRAENQDEADIDASMIDDEEGEDEDLPPIQWDPENPQMEEGSIFASMSECRNALVTNCIKAERTFEVDKSDTVRYRVHCPTDDCPWRMYASKMRNSMNIQVKVNPFRHTCLESTLRKETISRAKSRWVAEEVKRWVIENHQVGEVERTSPGSILDIDHHSVEYTLREVTMTKECFRRVFVCFEVCRRSFLEGCMPYLAIDATFLTGRFKGQLVAACAVDGHDFVFPVAYGVLETESEVSWTWFLQNLRRAIAHPNELVIHTDDCKGLEVVVDNVFSGVEHRECMCHLAANFRKKFKGKVYADNLWPASLTCSVKKHNCHIRQLYKNDKVKEYLETHHSKIWARSQFSDLSKVDYVHNNLEESFNSAIRKLKGLYLVDLLDKIRIEYIKKFHVRAGIATAKFMGDIIIPSVMNELKQKTRGLEMDMTLCSATTAKVSFLDKEKREWRYLVDLEARSCSCRQWQITGLLCIHALFFITTLSGQAGNIQQYVHEYYSVARFKATYAHALPALEGKQQWDIVDPGFKLCAPVLKRPAGRPRKSRIRPRSEGAGLGARKHKCTRCGGSGHFAKYCDNAVDPVFGECFDDENDGQQPVAPDDENDAHQPHDFANDPNDDSDDDQIEAQNDDQIDYQSDQNVEQNETPIEAPNDGDQNVEQNDAPIEAPKDGDQNVEQNDACSVVGSNKVVAVSSEVLEVEGVIELAEAFLTAVFAHLPSGSPVMFRLDEVRDGITLNLLTVTFTNPFDAYDLLGQVFWCGSESIFFTTYKIFTNYESIFPTANQMHSLTYQH